MEFFYALIPFIISTAALFLYKREREEPVLIYTPFIFSIFVIIFMSLIMRSSNFSDVEYRSYYYTKVRHYDSWWERQRRTRTIKVGDKTRTEVYYVTVRHPESWAWFDNSDNERSCSKEEFDNLRKLWGTPEVFVDMHRHYFLNDGDAQDYSYCGHPEHMRGYTGEYPYENRILGSENVMKFKKISKEEADSLGLHHYSSKTPLLGMIDQAGAQKLDYLNMMYGKEKEIHIFVLVFPASKTVEIVEDQRAYWQGGNKNELVVCVGVDTGNHIKWAESFSWQDSPELDVRCKEWLLGQKTLSISALANVIGDGLKAGMWKRKEFKDFSYISSYLTPTQNLTILVVVLIISILGPIYVIRVKT